METKKIKLYNFFGPGKVIIEYNDKDHRYLVNGERVISVTEATSIVDKSDALCGWTAKQMGLYLLAEKEKGNDIITEELVNRAKREYRLIKTEEADLGKIIHQWCSDFILKKNPEIPDDERAVNGITAFLKFQRENKLKFIESEKIGYSKKYKYCGIIDAVAKQGKDLILIDFKSSNNLYQEHFLQVCGYVIMYEEMTKKHIDKVILIKLGKTTGEFETRELSDEEVKRYKKGFLAALELRKCLDNIR